MKYISILISFLLIFSDYTRVFQLPSTYNRYLLIIAMSLIFFIKADLKENLKRLIYLFISFLFFLITGIKIPIYIIIYKELLRKSSLKKILKNHVIISSIFFFGIVSLGILGVYQNIIFKRTMFDGLNYNRNTLGFWSPNTWGIYWIHIFAGIMLLIKKHRIKVLIVGGTLTYIFYLKTISRTSILVIGVYIILYVIMIFYKERLLKLKSIYKYIPISLTLVSLFLAFDYSKKYYIINKILSGRLYLSNLAFKIYGISFLSNKQLSIPIDNSYIFFIISNGVFSLIIINIIYYEGIENIFKRKSSYIYIPYILAIFIYGFSENILSNYQGISILNILLCMKNRRVRRKNVFENKKNDSNVKKIK